MSMRQASPGPELEEDLEAEIQQDLDALSLDDDLDEDPGDEPPWENAPQAEDDQEGELPASLQDYLSMLQNQTDALQADLDECDQLIQQGETALVSARSGHDDLAEYASEAGMDAEKLRQQVLLELAKEEEEEQQSRAQSSLSVLADTATAESGPAETVAANSIAAQEESEEPADGDDHKVINPPHLTNGEDLTLKPVEAQLVEVSESQRLEQKFDQQVEQWTQEAAAQDEQRKQVLADIHAAAQFETEQREKRRMERQKQLQSEQEQLAVQRKQLEERLAKESDEMQKRIDESLKKYQAEMDALTASLSTEQQQWMQERNEEERRLQQRQQEAAVVLQSGYRGYRVRKSHGPTLQAQLEKRRLEKEDIRIKEIEAEREKERKKAEEAELQEKQTQEEELRKKLEEETRHKEEMERQAAEEQERQRELARKAEEEQKKAEEEARLRMEQQNREEEERLKAEMKRKQEEENMRIKQQKKEEERLKKEEEERLNAEKERLRKEEEEREKAELERKKKEAEEKLRLEEERKKAEAAKKKAEEMQKKEEARLKAEREKEKAKEKARKKAEQERKQAEEEARLKAEQEKKKRERMSQSLPEPLEKMRMSWIKNCKMWSKVASEQKPYTKQGNYKVLRRPASAKNLPPLTDEVLLKVCKGMALNQVTTVELQDLPGFSMSPLGQCPSLCHLVINRCHLVAVEGIEDHPSLKYADFSENQVELLCVRGNPQLVYLDVSHNSLASLHGLEGCTSLRHLDASYNKITRIGGLDSLKKLHTLNLSHNQLITTRGLATTVTLQHVDLSHNHLPVVDEVEALPLLQVLYISGNSLMQAPELASSVLLHKMVLEDNNLTSLSNLSQTWLPLLQVLNVSQNGLTCLDDLQFCISLRTLSLANNQILDLESLLAGLKALRSLSSLQVEGNPVAEETEFLSQVTQCVTTLCILDSHTLQPSTEIQGSYFEMMCAAQIEAQHALKKSFQETRSKHTDCGNLGLLYEHYYERSNKMAVEHRQMHEYGEISCRLKTSSSFDVSVLAQPPNMQTQSETATMKNKFDAAFQKAQHTVVAPSQTQIKDASAMKNKFEEALQEAEKKAVQPDAKGQPHTKAMAQQVLESSYVQSSQQGNRDTTFMGHKRDPTSVPSSKQPNQSATHMKQLIQHTSKDIPLCGRSENGAMNGHGDSTAPQVSIGSLAATKIQALWRGYMLRKRIMMALDWARVSDGEEDEEDEFKEIDLDSFNFDMGDIDQEWRPPPTPQLPTSHPVLSKPNLQTSPESAITSKPPVPPLHLFSTVPHPPTQPKQAWRYADSPLSEQRQHSAGGRPPLPPLSRMSDRSDATHDTRHTTLSKKSEKLQEEWGFKDSHTAELMLKRAKKLKYNAQKKKKLSQLDPRQRLALFRCLEESATKQPLQMKPQVAPRKEYFKAMEEAEQQSRIEKTQEVHHRVKRTFEWVHTQVGDHDVTDSRINRNLHRVNSESSLPHMTPSVLSGGRPSLTDITRALVDPPGPKKVKGSPIPMELQSVDSVSSYGDRRRHSTQNQAFNQPVQLPPIQTASAPSGGRAKERISRRDNPVDIGPGWGGGKKRAKLK